MTSSSAGQDTKPVTNYLRGAAIAFVAVSHYAITYHPAFYDAYLFDYANMVMAIFFVLSGYGIAISLERRHSRKREGRTWPSFYFDRAFRIYIPYWLALMALALFPATYLLRRLHPELIAIILGSPRMFWFVTAILECYLAAPFLFWVLRRFRLGGFALFSSLLTVMTLVVGYLVWHNPGWGANSVVEALMYRQYFLGNVVLFAFGMMIPQVAAWVSARGSGPAFMILPALAVFIYSLDVARFGFKFFPLLVAGCAAFCMLMISIRPRLPFGRLFILLGFCSYTLYLFHRTFFMLLDTLGLPLGSGVQGVVSVLLLSPLLVVFCYGLEKATAAAHAWFRELAPSPGREASPVPVAVKAAEQKTR